MYGIDLRLRSTMEPQPVPTPTGATPVTIDLEPLNSSERVRLPEESRPKGVSHRKKRPTPPLPVELIRPPVVNEDFEEIFTGKSKQPSLLASISGSHIRIYILY